MSHVFDALNRAGEEKKRSAQKAEGSKSLSDEKNVGAEDPGSNGNSAAEFLGGPDRTSNFERFSSLEQQTRWPRSWRDKLENILLGWGMNKFNSHPIAALEEGSTVAEQYKILREHVKKLRADTGVRCLSVTSPVQRDGKTTIAVNLAAAMALDYEERILLIDGDLRRPEVHRYFGVDPGPGLSDYLNATGNGNLMSYVRETFIPGLQIVTGGKPTKLSSELLAKQKMISLLEELHATLPTHQIILDAPPVLSTPDPLVIGRHVDGILMVVRAGKTPRDSLMKAIQSLNSTKIAGIVLNGVHIGSSSKYYSYSYSSNSA